MSKIILEIGTRKVYWEVSDEVVAILAQNLVQGLGPANGEVDD